MTEFGRHQRENTVALRAVPSTVAVEDDDSTNGNSDDAAAVVGPAWKRFFLGVLTGDKRSTSASTPLQKPEWLSPSSKLSKVLPTWIFHLRPSVQLVATIFLYLFHTAVLTQNSVAMPFQLFPNDRGNFQSIGLDSLAGMGTLGFYQYLRRQPSNFFNLEVKEFAANITSTPLDATNATATPTTTRSIRASYLPDLVSTPHPRNMPWKNVWTSKYSRFSSVLSLVALARAYFFTGRFSLFWEDKLYEAATHLPWMTVPMHRSLSVLLGHLSWIAIGALILRLVPRPQPFFQDKTASKWFSSGYRRIPSSRSGSGNNRTDITPSQLLNSKDEPTTFRSKHPQWMWWAIGGYFVSSWFFNISDFLNSYIFPVSVLEQAEENSLVARLVNPEGRDILASLVGYIAPCLTAPWWEEMLYRGFLLPSLVLQMGSYPLALFASGVLFSVHHQSELAFLPLCVLGWTWAIVYTKSKNLWTTILIHGMWNSRIFLGGWFGL